jgi:transposase-like protein
MTPTCPQCGSTNVRPFAPTAWGYVCNDCNCDFDSPPDEEENI